MRGEPCCDRFLAKGHRSGPSGFVICDGAGGNAAVAAAAALGARAGWRALLAVHRQLRRAPRRAPPALMVLRERFRRAFFHARPQAAPLMNHTVLACLWDRHHLVVAQVGDSSLLLRRGGEWSLPLPPAKGDFANETTFLRPDTPTEAIGLWWAPAMDIEAVIGFSDGLEAAFLAPQPGTPHVLVPNRPLAELVIGEHRRRHGSRGYPTWLTSSLADPSLRELSDDDLTLVIAA